MPVQLTGQDTSAPPLCVHCGGRHEDFMACVPPTRVQISSAARHVAIVPTRILRKWDAIAARQLCEAAAEQSALIDRLRLDLDDARDEARRADECAESWRDDALRMQEQLCEMTGGQPGLTQQGELVVVQGVVQ